MLTVPLDLGELPPDVYDRVLGAMIAHYDRELGVDVEAMLRGWAEQTAQHEEDSFSINPRGGRPSTDYVRLADAIAEHRAHMAGGNE